MTSLACAVCARPVELTDFNAGHDLTLVCDDCFECTCRKCGAFGNPDRSCGPCIADELDAERDRRRDDGRMS